MYKRQLLDRLKTLSAREAYQLAAMMLTTGRLREVSGKEGDELLLAVLKLDRKETTETINCLLSLSDYQVLCPAGGYEKLGEYYLRYEAEMPEAVLPYANLQLSLIHIYTRAARITALKGFANFLNSKGAQIRWPHVQRRCSGPSQFVPYIFTADEIVRILQTADSQKIPAHGSQFHLIFPTVLRVLYGTGLRISEALRLKCEDVDLPHSLLSVWDSKFDNSRRLPISPSLRDELLRYESRLRRPVGSAYFFPNSKGLPYSQRTVYDLSLIHICGKEKE